MNFTVVRTIFFKEMLDTFRDKRTLIAMIGVPVVLYPLLFIALTQVTVVQQNRLAEEVSTIAFAGAGADRVRPWLDDPAKFEVVESDAPLTALADRELDALVTAGDDFDIALDGGGTGLIEIAYDATEPRSREASGRIEDALVDARDALLQGRLSGAGLAESFARPIRVERENVAPPAKSTGSILGTILPLIMVVMLGVGAFYPAVDLTAGEKERGTFETLLSTPTSKLEIIFGKFFAVFSLSILTGLLNLASMIATVMIQLTQILNVQEQSAFELDLTQIPLHTIVVILIILFPLALFISAMMMTVALLARSFKEAQNYVTPFFLAILIPASVVVIPGIDLTRTTQFLPVANVSLLFRDLLMARASADMAFVVFMTTAIYALIALVLATWMFQREDVVLSEERGVPLTFHRSLIAPRAVPTLGLSLGIFATVMLLIFYVGSYAQSRNMHAGLLLTQYALILAPVLVALLYGKVNVRESLNLRVPSVGAVGGAVLIIPGMIVLAIQVGVFQNRVFPMPEALQEQMEGLFDLAALPGGVVGLLFLVAVSPAICEEVLFRGVLVSGLRERLPQWALILGVGVLFGLFHLSIYRVVPTGVTGIVLTYLVVRSGSIFLPMLAHLALNGFSILVETGSLPRGFLESLEGIDESGLPTIAIVAGLGSMVLGVVLMELSRRGRRLE